MLERNAGLFAAPQLLQQVAAHGRKRRVVAQFRLVYQSVDDGEAGLGTFGTAHGHRAIEFHHRRWRDLHQSCVQGGDGRPVGLLESQGAGMAGRERRLQHVDAIGAAEPPCPLQGLQPALDLQSVPA